MDENKGNQNIITDRRRFDKAVPYILGALFAVIGFLSQQVYAELSSKPSKAEVKVIIEERIKPLEACLNENTSKISAFEVALNGISALNTTLLKIDARTIEQGKDISAIKVKVNQLD